MGRKNPFHQPGDSPSSGTATGPSIAHPTPTAQRRVRWGIVVATALLLALAAVCLALAYFWQFQQQEASLREAELSVSRRRTFSLLNERANLERDRDQAQTQLRESNTAGKRLRTELQKLQEEHRNVTETHRQLEEQMRSALESRDVTISELAGKLTVNILDRVLFASGEADITPQGEEVLRQVAGVLGQFTNRQVQVIGHTDNVPIHTTRFPSNWELSAARAIAAVRFLTEQAGVDPQRLGALGYGEFHPAADNATPEGRAQNRRIAIVILPELLSTNAEPTQPSSPSGQPAEPPPNR